MYTYKIFPITLQFKNFCFPQRALSDTENGKNRKSAKSILEFLQCSASFISTKSSKEMLENVTLLSDVFVVRQFLHLIRSSSSGQALPRLSTPEAAAPLTYISRYDFVLEPSVNKFDASKRDIAFPFMNGVFGSVYVCPV